MEIIYACYGGAHSSPVAAALHLGWLTPGETPSHRKLLALPLFDKAKKDEQGRLFFAGPDEAGHNVYVLGRGPSGRTVERALLSGLALAGREDLSVRFVDTLTCVNIWMRVGGFLSRGIGWVGLGRPLVLFGTRRALRALTRLVAEVKQKTAEEIGDGRRTPIQV